MSKNRRKFSFPDIPTQDEASKLLDNFNKLHNKSLYSVAPDLAEVLLKIEHKQEVTSEHWKKVAPQYRQYKVNLESAKNSPSSLSDYLLYVFSALQINNELEFEINLVGYKSDYSSYKIYFDSVYKATKRAQNKLGLEPYFEYNEEIQDVTVSMSARMILKEGKDTCDINNYVRKLDTDFRAGNIVASYDSDILYFNEFHKLLVNLTDKHSERKKDIYFYAQENYIDHNAIVLAKQDTNFLAELQNYDSQLYALYKLYFNDVSEYRQGMINAINNNPKWQIFLNSQINELSVGKLEYLLKRNIGKEYEIFLGYEPPKAPKCRIEDNKFKSIWNTFINLSLFYNPKMGEIVGNPKVQLRCKGETLRPGVYTLTLEMIYENGKIDDFSQNVSLEELYEFIYQVCSHETHILRNLICFY